MGTAGFGAILLLSLSGWAARPAGLEIRSDPRVELFAVLHALSVNETEADGFRWNETAYSQLLKARVEPLRDHAAVGLYRRAYSRAQRRGWRGYMGVLNAVLDCVEETLSFSSKGACSNKKLAQEACDFAQKAGLLRFPQARRALGEYEAGLRLEARRLKPLLLFSELTGLESPVPHRISPSPLMIPGQVWNHLERDSAGRIESILTVVGSRREGAGLVFSFLPLTWDIWHEQSHAQLDEELEAYPERGQRLRENLEPLAAICYEDWRQCLREHMAQGVAQAVGRWAQAAGRPSGSLPPAKESLPYLGLVVERLEEFQTNRSRYRSLRNFYPRLLDIFEEIKLSTATIASAPPRDPRIKPGRPWKESGLAHFQEGRLKQARDNFVSALKADPRDPEAHLSLGVVLMEMGKHEQALRSLDQAVALARENPERGAFLSDALSSRASLLKRLGRFSDSRRDYEEALDAAPDGWSQFDQVEALLNGLPR